MRRKLFEVGGRSAQRAEIRRGAQHFGWRPVRAKEVRRSRALAAKRQRGHEEQEGEIPAQGKGRLKEAVQRLVQLYEATDQAEKATEWKGKLADFETVAAPVRTAVPQP